MLRCTMSHPTEAGQPKALRVLKLLLGLALVATLGVFGFARFGDPQFMPDGVYRLAQSLRNPHIRPEVPIAWTRLCMAWDGWLGYLEREAPRLLETEGLWETDDSLRSALQDFSAASRQMHPHALVPVAAGADLAVLALVPPSPVLAELQIPAVAARVQDAAASQQRLSVRLETWGRWKELRALRSALAGQGRREVAALLSPRLPPSPGSQGYRLNLTRTVKQLDDLASNRDGLLQLAKRWHEYLQLAARLEKSADPGLRQRPAVLLGRVPDQSSLRDLAATLETPIAEMRQLLPPG